MAVYIGRREVVYIETITDTMILITLKHEASGREWKVLYKRMD